MAGSYYAYKETCNYGAVYEYTTEDHTCEGEDRLAAVSDERFENNGHALAWAMAQ